MYKYNMGGSVPQQTNIAGQRHSLAYINPFEEDLLNTQYRGGEGQPVPPVPGPGGVPSYPSVDDGYANKKTTEEKVTAPSNPGDRSGSGNAAFDNLQKQMTNRNKDDNDRKVVQVSGPPIKTVMPVTRDTATSTSSGPTGKELDDARIARLAKGISGIESLANTLTPNDFMVYNSAGQLVYQQGHKNYDPRNPNKLVSPDETNSFGFKVGMGNTGSNDATPGMYNQGFGSGIKSDFDMKYAAGFGSREEQRKNLLLAGYTSEQVDAYFAETEAAMARDPYVPGSGDDRQNNIIKDIAAEVVDPCPEGYKMDPVTNACVIDPDIGMGPPVFTPSDPNAGSPGSPGYTQPIGNFIPTPLQPNPVNPMQQQLNNLTRSLQPQQNRQAAGGLAGIRR